MTPSLDTTIALAAHGIWHGRAGRDGEDGQRTLLYFPDDIRLQKSFLMKSKAPDEGQERDREKLDRWIGYAQSGACRWLAAARLLWRPGTRLRALLPLRQPPVAAGPVRG